MSILFKSTVQHDDKVDQLREKKKKTLEFKIVDMLNTNLLPVPILSMNKWKEKKKKGEAMKHPLLSYHVNK